MDPSEVAARFFLAAAEIPEPFSSLSESQKQMASELLDRFDAAESALGSLPRSEVIRPMLLCKNGRYKEAIDVTDRAHRQAPSWKSAVAVANTARRAGDLERAVAMFAEASRHDVHDATALLEVGDIHLAQGRWSDAIAAYEEALVREPLNSWALPSVYFCRDRLDPSGGWRKSLRELTNAEPCRCGLERCLTSLFGASAPRRAVARAKELLDRIDRTEGLPDGRG